MTANDLLDQILETKYLLEKRGLHDTPLVIYIGSDTHAEVKRTLHTERFRYENRLSFGPDLIGRDFDFCGHPGHVVSTPDYLHIAVA